MASSVNMTPGISYDARLSAENEIRLVEIQPWTPDTPHVICVMTRSTIDAARETGYEALSYTWGSPDSPRAHISINGRLCEVRENLRDAMQQFSKREDVCRIWIDALCINQSDVEERNAQVKQMARIYGEAKVVDVWLGLESPKDVNAARYIEEIRSQDSNPSGKSTFVQTYSEWFDAHPLEKCLDSPEHANAPRYIEEIRSQDSNPSGKSTFDQTSSEWFDSHLEKWESIAYLCHRPYWSRLWIIQELFLASNVHARCGGMIVDLNMLKDLLTALVLLPRYTGQNLAMLKTVRDSPYSMLHHAELSLILPSFGGTWVHLHGNRTRPLLFTMSSFYAQQCFNVVDQIFALHSLSDACCVAAVPVDYSKQNSDLCIALLEHHVMEHGLAMDTNHDFPHDFFSGALNMQRIMFRGGQALDDEVRFVKLVADVSSRNKTPFKLATVIQATVLWASPELHLIPAHYLENALSDAGDISLFPARAKDLIDFHMQISSDGPLTDQDWTNQVWTNQITLFNSIKVVNWPASAKTNLSTASKLGTSPEGDISSETLRAALKDIIRLAQFLTRSYCPTGRSYRLLFTDDGDFLLGPNTTSEHDLLCRCITQSGRLGILARRTDSHALETTGIAVSILHSRKKKAKLREACEVEFEVGFEVLLGITGMDERHQGHTLVRASHEGHMEMVQLLLDRGVSVHLPHPTLGSPLLAALAKGHNDIVQALRAKGAVDITGIDKTHQGGILVRASREGHTELVQLLLNWGDGVRLSHDTLDSALLDALVHGHDDIVKALLVKGAVSAFGVVARNSERLVKPLLEDAFRVKDEGNSFSLAYSILTGHPDMAWLLVRQGFKFCNIGGTTFEIFERAEVSEAEREARYKDGDGPGNNLMFRVSGGNGCPLGKLFEAFAAVEERFNEIPDDPSEPLTLHI